MKIAMKHASPCAISLLIVEDDVETLRLNHQMIARKFPEVVIRKTENGRKGLELSRDHAPDIVVTNIRMPEMDGIQMAAEIKSVKDDTKFIVLSGYSENKCQKELKDLGIKDFFLKPVEFSELIRSIARCIGEIHQARA